MPSRPILDANVKLLEWLDGNTALFTITPIDAVNEFYWINKDDKTKIMAYMNKGINNPQHIQTIDSYFNMIWMPIPWWFYNYKTQFENEPTTNGWDGTVQTIEDEGTTTEWMMEAPKRKTRAKT